MWRHAVPLFAHSAQAAYGEPMTSPVNPNSDSERPSVRTATALRGLLASRNLKGRDLASALKKSPSAASRRLSGQVDFTLDEVDVIAMWLDVPPSALLMPANVA